jgi:general secretion pathway protein K
MSARPHTAHAGVRPRRERGVALVQVLLITGIIGLLMLQLALTAREQVTRATLVADRVEADLRARSREAAVIYSLLTLPWERDAKSPNPYAVAWNFIGEPVVIDEATLTLQDQAGLMPVPRVNMGRFEGLLRAIGVDAARAGRIGAELLARVGGPTGRGVPGSATGQADPSTMGYFPVQTLDELLRLPDMDDALYRTLVPLLTLYPTRNFNPLTAPPQVLAARLPPSQLQVVLDLRSQQRLDMTALAAIAGDDPDDFASPTSGPGVAIDIALAHGTAHAHRHLVVGIEPYELIPVQVWERGSGSPWQ